jgi:hypothetical protein
MPDHVLTEVEAAHLRHMEEQLQVSKLLLADADLAVAMAEARRQAARMAVQEKHNALLGGVQSLAQTYGFKSDEKWNFDMARKTFSEVV